MNNIFRKDQEAIEKMLFENKNKSYGAYELRASYSATATKASLITGSTFLLLMILLLSLTNGKIVLAGNTDEVLPTSRIIGKTEVDATPKDQKKESKKILSGGAALKQAEMSKVMNSVDTTAITKDQNNMNAISGISLNPNANGTSRFDSSLVKPTGGGLNIGENNGGNTGTKKINQWA